MMDNDLDTSHFVKEVDNDLDTNPFFISQKLIDLDQPSNYYILILETP